MPQKKKEHKFSDFSIEMMPYTKKLLEGRISIPYYRQKARETRKKLGKKK